MLSVLVVEDADHKTLIAIYFLLALEWHLECWNEMLPEQMLHIFQLNPGYHITVGDLTS